MRQLIIVLLIIITGSVYGQKKESADTTLKRNQGNAQTQGQGNTTAGQEVHITPGSSGVKRSIGYRFSSQTSNSDPGEGTFRFDNPGIGGVSFMYIDNVDIAGDDQTQWYSTWEKETGASGRGGITIAEKSGKVVALVNITGVMTDAGGFWRVPVEVASGSIPVNGTIYYYVFERIRHRKEVPERPQTEPPVIVSEPPKPEEEKPVVEAPKPVEEKPIVVPQPPKPAEEKPVVEVPKPVEEKPVVVPQPPKPEEEKPVVVPEPPKPAEEKPVVEVPKPTEEKPVPVTPKPEKPKPEVVVVPAVEKPPVVTETVPEKPKPVVVVPVAEEKEPVTTDPKVTQKDPVAETKPVTEQKPATTTSKPVRTETVTTPTETRRQVQTTVTNEPVASTKQTTPAEKTTVNTTNQTVLKSEAVEVNSAINNAGNTSQTTRVTSDYYTGNSSQPQNSPPPTYSSLPVVQNIFENPNLGRARGKWYCGIIEAGYGFDIGTYGSSNFRFNFINGFKLGQIASAGLGIGYRRYFPDMSSDPYFTGKKSQVPVFLDLRTTFSKRKITPYLAFDIGATVEEDVAGESVNHLLIGGSLGIWWNISKRFALFAGAGYEQIEQEFSDVQPVVDTYLKPSGSVSINIGIAF